MEDVHLIGVSFFFAVVIFMLPKRGKDEEFGYQSQNEAMIARLLGYTLSATIMACSLFIFKNVAANDYEGFVMLCAMLASFIAGVAFTKSFRNTLRIERKAMLPYLNGTKRGLS